MIQAGVHWEIHEFKDIVNKVFINGEIKSIQDNISQIQDKFSELSTYEEIEEIKTLINALEINEKIKPVVENLKGIHKNITESLAVYQSGSFDESIVNLQDRILLLQDKLDNVSDLSIVDDLREEIISTSDKFEEVKENLDTTFDRIINIVIESKRITEEHGEIIDNCSNISKDTNQKLNGVFKKACNIDDAVEQINKNMEDLLSTVSDFENIKSLPEIEIINNNLNNLKNDIQDFVDKFGEINTEVSDISSKVNKLIITSGDNADLLKSNLSQFKELLEVPNKKLENFNNNINHIK